MTVNEAISTHIVLTYLVGMKHALDAMGVTDEAYGDVLEAAALLADRAHKALGAGADGARVRERWARRET